MFNSISRITIQRSPEFCGELQKDESGPASPDIPLSRNGEEENHPKNFEREKKMFNVSFWSGAILI